MNTTCLLTIDFINEIVHPKGKIAHNAARIEESHTIRQANLAITHARQNSMLLAHVKVGFSNNYVECSKVSPMFSSAEKFGALKLGTWGTEFHDKLDVIPEDTIIVKHRINPFYGTSLETILRSNNIDTLVLCGVSTNYAIEHCAREAHDRDYKVIVLEDACQSSSQEVQNASLNSLSKISSIKTVNDWISNN